MTRAIEICICILLLSLSLAAVLATGTDTEHIIANQLAPNRFTQENEFAGGIRITGGFMTLLTSADCSIVACTAAGQACVTGSNLFLCDTTALLYKPVTTGTPSAPSSSPSVLNLQPQSCVPTTCTRGQLMMLTNGAMCHCYDTDSYENTGGTGVCESCTAGGGGPGHQL